MKDPESYYLMQRPEVQKRVVEIKSEEPSITWENVGNVIEEEFGKKVGINVLIDTYRKATATAITVERKGNKQFTHLVDKLKERFEKQIERTEILSKAFDSLIDKIENHPDLDDLQKANAKWKLISDFEKLQKVFQMQMGSVMDELDKIKIEQKKIIYTDADIIEKINETLPYILKQFEDNGQIAILDQSVLDK